MIYSSILWTFLWMGGGGGGYVLDEMSTDVFCGNMSMVVALNGANYQKTLS